MRRLVINADLFDTFLFPNIAQSNAKTDSERETALRVLKKIKDPAITTEKPLTRREEQLQKEGERVFSYRILRGEEATFLLEEDEWKFVKTRLKDNAGNIALLALEEFNNLLEIFEQAEEIKVEIEKEKEVA